LSYVARVVVLARRGAALRGRVPGTAGCAIDRSAWLGGARAPTRRPGGGWAAPVRRGRDAVARGARAMTTVRQDRPLTDSTTRELLSSLLRDWYGRGWVSGTGGGICGPTEDGNLFLAPTGVHKELVRPDDFFVVSPADGRVVQEPKTPGLRPSECNSIFGLIWRERGARSVAHSHSLSAVLAGDLAADGDH